MSPCFGTYTVLCLVQSLPGYNTNTVMRILLGYLPTFAEEAKNVLYNC